MLYDFLKRYVFRLVLKASRVPAVLTWRGKVLQMHGSTAENDDDLSCSFLKNSGTITVVYEEQSVLVLCGLVSSL